jgi:hypothetical protein
VRRVPVRVTTRLGVAPQTAFESVAPIELPRIFQGWGLLPAVTGTRDQTGPWDRVGVSRTVLLADGSSAQEELVAYNPPHHFGYKLTFGKPFGAVVSEAAGTWWFSPAGDGGTEVEWTYAFAPRPGAGLLVELGLAPLWRRYAEDVLARCVAEIER